MKQDIESQVWPPVIYEMAVGLLDATAKHASSEDGVARLEFEALHPSTQIALLDALQSVLQVVATATRAG